MYVCDSDSKFPTDLPENICSTAIGLVGTTQFSQASNAKYDGYSLFDIRARAKKILKIQMFIHYQIMFIMFCLSHPVEYKLLPKLFWQFTPDSFAPESADVDTYLQKPKFMWRISMGNYGYYCNKFSKYLPFYNNKNSFTYKALQTYQNDDSPIIPFVQSANNIVKSTFKEKMKLNKHTSNHHIKLEKIAHLQEKFDYQISIYEQSEIFHSDDVQLHLLDSTFTFADFVNLVVTGYSTKGPGNLLLLQIAEYNKKINNEKAMKKSEKEMKKILKKTERAEKKAFKFAMKEKKLNKSFEKTQPSPAVTSDAASKISNISNMNTLAENGSSFGSGKFSTAGKKFKNIFHISKPIAEKNMVSVDVSFQPVIANKAALTSNEIAANIETDEEIQCEFVDHLECPNSPVYYLGRIGTYNKRTRLSHFVEMAEKRKQECPVENELYVNSKWCHEALLVNYNNTLYIAALEYFGPSASVNKCMKDSGNGEFTRVGWSLPGTVEQKEVFLQSYYAALEKRKYHCMGVPYKDESGNVVTESFFSVLDGDIVKADDVSAPIISLPPTIRSSDGVVQTGFISNGIQSDCRSALSSNNRTINTKKSKPNYPGIVLNKYDVRKIPSISATLDIGSSMSGRISHNMSVNTRSFGIIKACTSNKSSSTSSNYGDISDNNKSNSTGTSSYNAYGVCDVSVSYAGSSYGINKKDNGESAGNANSNNGQICGSNIISSNENHDLNNSNGLNVKENCHPISTNNTMCQSSSNKTSTVNDHRAYGNNGNRSQVCSGNVTDNQINWSTEELSGSRTETESKVSESKVELCGESPRFFYRLDGLWHINDYQLMDEFSEFIITFKCFPDSLKDIIFSQWIQRLYDGNCGFSSIQEKKLKDFEILDSLYKGAYYLPEEHCTDLRQRLSKFLPTNYL